MEKYLFLTPEDKKRLIKLAESKQLSLSTTAGIIINWIAPLVDNMYTDYIKRGDKMIHIKIRPNEYIKQSDLTSMTATNCIYCYFNKPLWKGKKINWQNKYIQSELDRTEDPNRYKNMEIRIAYRLKKGII